MQYPLYWISLITSG
ncbi:hypothetical protein LINPERPRIM_LOCUS11845 [Linum perenne]